MSSYRIIKRGVEFNVEGDPLTRSDYDERQIDNLVKSRGMPVPIVFGTRIIEPTVVAWSHGTQASGYYSIYKKASDGSDNFIRDAGNTAITNTPTVGDNGPGNPIYTERITFTTARLVLCVGKADIIGPWTADNQPFTAYPEPLPPITLTGATEFVENLRKERAIEAAYVNLFADQQNLVIRLVVSIGDADLFGGGLSGGLGFPFKRGSYGANTRFSQFWFAPNGLKAEPVLQDADIPYSGVSTLYFKNFNFGGSSPPPSWRVGVSRVEKQTARTATGYKDQWQPTFKGTDNSLVSINTLTRSLENLFYLIAFAENLTDNQGKQLADYVKSLPYNDETVYKLIRLPSLTVDTINPDEDSSPKVLILGGGFQDVTYTTREDFKSGVERYLVRPGRSSGLGPVNFIPYHADEIVAAYIKQMRQHLLLNSTAHGVIVYATTDIVGTPSTTFATEQEKLSYIARVRAQIQSAAIIFNALKYPPENFDEYTRIMKRYDVRADPLAAKQASALEILRRYPPETRMVLWKYWREKANDPVFGEYVAPLPFSFSVYPPAAHEMADWYSVDSIQNPIIAGDTATNKPVVSTAAFKFRFNVGLPAGETMNPIHALRELLTNKDWGEGIPEDKIDETAFYNAAVVCHNEGLDYCNVLDQIGENDKMIKGITDYVDGVLYYNPALDLVTLKLIRDDYNIDHIPSFDESTLSEITAYKRQHSQDLINSVTVNFHDAAKGSNETFTIHDLVASDRVGKVVSAAISYDGCATARAAEVVAKRDLAALSQSVISFTAKINPPATPLGLGDPIVVSYKDLGIARVVMRISSISYGDGLMGGISVRLIQDVFSTLITSELVEPDLPIQVIPPVETDLFDVSKDIMIAELSISDTVGARIDDKYYATGGSFYGPPDFRRPDVFTEAGSAPGAYATRVSAYAMKYLLFKAGLVYRRGKENLTVSINNEVLPVSIGVLLTRIPYPNIRESVLTQLGDTDVIPVEPFKVKVRISSIPSDATSGVVRVDNEEIVFTAATKISDDVFEVTLADRALGDTVPEGHRKGANFWFLGGAKTITKPIGVAPNNYVITSGYDREYYGMPVTVTENGVTTTQYVPLGTNSNIGSIQLYAQNIFSKFCSRALLAYPPFAVVKKPVLNESGNIEFVYVTNSAYPRKRGTHDYDQWSEIELYIVDKTPGADFHSTIHTALLNAPRPRTVGTYELSFDLASFYPGGNIPQVLEFRFFGAWPNDLNFLTSWQTWNFVSDSRPVPVRQGWGYQFGKNWGSSDLEGWNYDWDNNWGD